MGPDIVRFQFEGPMKFLLDDRPIPVIIELGKSQRSVGLGKCGIDCKSFLCRALRPGHRLSRPHLAVTVGTQEDVGVRYAGVCQGKVGIELKGSLEIADPLL